MVKTCLPAVYTKMHLHSFNRITTHPIATLGINTFCRRITMHVCGTQHILRNLNGLTVIAHAINAIAAALVPTTGGIYTLTYRVLRRGEKGVFKNWETVDASMTLNLRWLIVIFFACSAFFQSAAYAFKPYAYLQRCGTAISAQAYTSLQNANHAPQHGVHWLRFIEYSVSASSMLVAIALLTGVDDIHELICIFMLCVSTQLFGLLAERQLQNDVDTSQRWIAHVAGWVSFVSAYGVVLSHYVVNKQAMPSGSARIPWFVDVIVVSMAVLFSMFGVVQLASTVFPKSVTLFHAEITYLILSIVAKTLLGWLVLGVALRPK
jgi:hypothetical protein